MYQKLLILLSCLVFATSALAADVSGLISKLDTDDYGLRKTARIELRQAITDSAGVDRVAAIEQLHGAISADHSFAVRDWSIRMLELFGGEASTLPLAQLLVDKDVRIRDLARLALQANPSDAATRVLENALSGVPTEEQGAILDALAYRGDVNSVSKVAALLDSESYAVAAKAAMALGKIGGKDAEAALMKKTSSASVELKQDIAFALLDAGLSDVPVAKALAVNGQNTAVKLGAFQQLITLDAASAKALLQTAINDDAYPARSLIIRAALTSAMQEEVIDLLPSLDASTQAIFLGVISDLELNQYEPQVLAILERGSAEIKSEAIKTLGVIGSDQSYPALYELYLADSNNSVIKEALIRINAPAADADLLKAASDSSHADAQVAAVKLMTLRNTKGAIDLINQLVAETTNSELKKAAFQSMELIGGKESVDVLLAAVLKNDADTRAAQGSLKKLSVSLASSDGLWTSSFAPALKSAANDEQRKAILAILDGVSCKPAADYLQNLIVTDSSLQADAVRSLSRWSDVSGGDVWLAVMSKSGASEADAAAAVKGISRLVSQRGISGESNEKFDLAAKAINAAPSLEFKQSILDIFKGMSMNRKTQRAFNQSFKSLASDPEIGEQVKKLMK
ncbi:MAG: HEAT repeat domain-containing protein [Opitutaceae bacterium]